MERARQRRGAEEAQPGTVYLVGAGPGDPGLFTRRGAELLASADVVLHDELVHPALLDLAKRARARGGLVHVGKRGHEPGSKQAKQDEIERRLVELAKQGLAVVRLKGGDPFLFGRGSEEAEALVSAGIPFEVVPGVPSPLGATAYAGISLTHRDLASSVVFLSGTTRRGEPFDWSEIAGVRGTVCVLMGMHRLEEVARGLVETAGRDPGAPSAVIQWGTRGEQRTVTAPLARIARAAREAGLGSPALVVVGDVVSLRERLRWFDARPLLGRRVLVGRPEGQASETSRLLGLRGALPVELPLVEILPASPAERARAEDAARALAEGAYDAVAFTSETAVERFFEILSELGLDARALRARVACVGRATAAALSARGIRADVEPSRFVGEALAEALLLDLERTRPGGARGARLLLPRARVAREVLVERLGEAGISGEVLPVYETRRLEPSDARAASLRDLLERRALDVALLTSKSSADALADVLGERAAELLDGVFVASIGPVTTAAAEARGIRVDATAEESTSEGLVEALEAALSKEAAARPPPFS